MTFFYRHAASSWDNIDINKVPVKIVDQALSLHSNKFLPNQQRTHVGVLTRRAQKIQNDIDDLEAEILAVSLSLMNDQEKIEKKFSKTRVIREGLSDLVHQTDQKRPKYYTKTAAEDRFVKRDIDIAAKFLKSHFSEETESPRIESVAYRMNEENLIYEAEFTVGEKLGSMTFGRDLEDVTLVEKIEPDPEICREINFIIPLEGRLDETKKFLDDIQTSFEKGEVFR